MIKKGIAAIAAGLILALTAAGAKPVMADKVELDKPYIALGADLSASDRAVVLELLGVTEQDLEGYTVETVTNADEHEYLDAYLSASVIGTRALSSVKVIGRKDGSGINVTTKNISYCTTGMYQNCLVTAGVEDAEVVVAGPFNISGTAALVGTIKAYSSMTGEALNPDNIEAATNELVVTSQLGENIQDQDKAEELIGAVKDIIVAEEITDPAKIEETIDDTAQKLEIELSEQDRQEIAALMTKISDLDLDIDTIKEQAKELYDKLGSLDIDLDLSEESVDGFFAGLGSWFEDMWQNIKGFFSDLFAS